MAKAYLVAISAKTQTQLVHHIMRFAIRRDRTASISSAVQ